MIKKIKSNEFTYPIIIILIIIMIYKCLTIIKFESYMDKIEVDNTLKYIITTDEKPKIKLLKKLAIKLNEKKDYKNYDKVEYYFIDEIIIQYQYFLLILSNIFLFSYYSTSSNK